MVPISKIQNFLTTPDLRVFETVNTRRDFKLVISKEFNQVGLITVFNILITQEKLSKRFTVYPHQFNTSADFLDFIVTANQTVLNELTVLKNQLDLFNNGKN